MEKIQRIKAKLMENDKQLIY